MRSRQWMSALMGLLLAVTPSLARAQETQTSCPRCTVGDVDDALPGIVHTAVPRLQRAVSASFMFAGNYGVNIDPLGAGSMHHRLGGTVAGAVHIVPWLAIGLRVYGRYDMVSVRGQADEDGLFGFPTLTLRASMEPVRGLSLGLDVQASVFGAEAPSFEFGSTSLLARAMGAYAVDLGGANLTFALNAGYYLDNSRVAAPQTVTDPLQPGDQLSIGVSDVGAVVLGFGGVYSSESVEVFVDWGYRLYIGAGNVTANSPMRVALGARFWAVPEVFFIGVAADMRVTGQSALLVAPGMTNAPVEPGFTAHLNVGIRVGAETPSAVTEDGNETPDEVPVDEVPVVATSGSALGRVTDPEGNPVVGASVELTGTDATVRTATTDNDGRWRFDEVPLGEAQYRITAESFDLIEGTTTVTPEAPVEAAVPMVRRLPQAEIRGVIQGGNGQPIVAHIQIGDRELDTDAEGSFTVEVPPGEYDVTVSAPGHREQTRHVRVEERGVVVLNAQLRPGRGRTR